MTYRVNITSEQRSFILRYYMNETVRHLSKRTGLSAFMVRKIATEAGLSKGRDFCCHRFSEEDIEYLKANFANTYNKQLCEHFHISLRTLVRKARELGLVKSSEFMKESQHHAVLVAQIKCRENGYYDSLKGQHIPNSEKHQFDGRSLAERYGEEKARAVYAKGRETRLKTLASERRRMLYGLEQRTRLKLTQQPRAKVCYRSNMRRKGYIEVPDIPNVLFFTDTTVRGKLAETHAADHRIRILPYAEINNF